MKNSKGITLIALVITIIVLIILAGVSINLVLGEDGIFKRAIEAREKTEQAAINEQAMLNSVYDEMEKLNEENLPKTKDETPNSIYQKDENTYVIQSIEDLVILSKTVNGEQLYVQNKFTGKKIEIEIDLDFNSENSYIDAQSTSFGDINGNNQAEPLITELTTLKGFTPIGTSTYPFEGRIEGNNSTIFGLYINADKWVYSGLIGYTNGTQITNLSLRNVNIEGNSAETGAFIGKRRWL